MPKIFAFIPLVLVAVVVAPVVTLVTIELIVEVLALVVVAAEIIILAVVKGVEAVVLWGKHYLLVSS